MSKNTGLSPENETGKIAMGKIETVLESREELSLEIALEISLGNTLKSGSENSRGFRNVKKAKLKELAAVLSNVSPAAKEISSILEAAGYTVYIVGGFVRDALLGTIGNRSDIDFATDALPSMVEEIFHKTFPSGKKHGTITVLIGKESFEVTTFRSDGMYENSRHPTEVSFSKDFSSDVLRRDFTVNALAYSISKNSVLDLCGGLKDLSMRLLRCIGEANTRFLEDALRMLRACRFVAQLSFSATAETESSITKLAGNIKKISAERVREEWEKIFLCNSPMIAVEMMKRTGLLSKLLPELALAEGIMQNKFHPNCVYTHSLHVVDAVLPQYFLSTKESAESKNSNLKTSTKKPVHTNEEFQRWLRALSKEQEEILIVVRWAALFHDLGKVKTKKYSEAKKDFTFYGHEMISEQIALRVMKQYKFSKKRMLLVAKLVRLHMLHYENSWSDSAVRRFIARVGEENLSMFFLLVRADRVGKDIALANGVNPSDGGGENDFSDLKNLEARISQELKNCVALRITDLQINGKLLMQACNLKPGPQVGAALRHLLSIVIEHPNRNTTELLLSEAKSFFKKNS